MSGENTYEDVGRQHPAHGVHIDLQQPTILLVTVCTKDRNPWLAQSRVHDLLRATWIQAKAWMVGYYLLMPDHVHMFCAPHDLAFSVERWLTYWKSQFTKAHQNLDWRFQTDAFHHRLRRQEGYIEKWSYVRLNPVRKGLVCSPEEWPYWGMLNVLQW